MNRHALKALCVVAAVLIWIQVASTRTAVKDISLPLTLAQLPPQATLAGNDWPESVAVRARGTRLQFFLQRYLGRAPGEVRVDLQDVSLGGLWQRDLTANDVRSSLTDVTVVEPTRLLLFVDRLDSTQVAVVPAVTGEVPAGRIMIGEVAAEPDRVTVRGPARFLEIPSRLTTEPLDLRRVRRGQPVVRHVLSPGEHLEVLPTTVSLAADVVEAERRTLEHVPVVPLVDAGQPTVEIFPPVVSVVLEGPQDEVGELSLADFTVTLALTGLTPGSHTLTPEVLLPPGCRLVRLDPPRVLAVLGAGADAGDLGRAPFRFDPERQE